MLFFVFLFALTADCRAEGNGEEGRHTAYACEGRQLNIACESSNYVVHLLRANYGRFSISICNEHGNLDWSVACTSAASFYVIKDACGLKNNCTLSASPALFGDPCPGTPKYLEAHYQCIPEKSSGAPLTSTMVSTSSTTSTSRPPIIIPVTRNVRPYMPAIVTDDVRTPSSSQMSSSSTTNPEDVPTTEELPPTTHPTTVASADSSSSESVDNILVITGLSESSTLEPSTVHQSRWSPGNNGEEDDPQSSGLWCAPAQSRGLYWNWTRAGHVAVHKCPGGGIGRAKWRCDLLSVQWVPDSPDFSDCTSLWVDNIKYRISRGDSVTTLAAELAVITRTKSLMPGDIVHTADILHKLVGEMGERARDVDYPQPRQRLLLALLEAVLEVSSNLLEDSQRLPWNDLNVEQQQKSAAALLRSQEKSGWLLAESHHSRYYLQNGQRHVLIAVHVVESWDISDLILPPPVDTTWWGVEDRLLVPAPSLLATAKQGISRLVLLVHSRLGDLLGTEVRPALTPPTNLSRIVNSRVIGALLEGHRVLSLPRPITVTFKHLQVENVSNPMCVFWDYQLRSWSTEGCWLKYSNRTHTVCQCSHLTNLAIIMHISETQDQPLSSDHVTLRMLVYIGCAVAMIFLLVTILILQFVRCIRTERISIHKHLCLCLLLAEVALVGGLEQAEEPRACSILAGLLHYLLLAAFAWAFLDSFHLYIFLRDSELQPLMWRMKWYTIVAYGIPLVVVTVSAIIDPASYGTDTYCWLRVDNYYVFSFGGPAIACALASVLFLCLTVGRVCAQRNSTIPVKSKDQTKLSTVSKWSGEATVLLLILCSTWTLLPLFLHRERPLTAYFFLGLNSLQGLLVFLFYCIDGDKVPGAEEPPGPVWLCSCLRQAPRRRNHHLYSPTSTSNCHLHNPQQQHHNHQANSVGTTMSPTHHQNNHLIHNLTPPPPALYPERRCGVDSCEEHPLQYLLPHDNQQPQQQQYHSDHQHQWGCPRNNERGLCCYRGPRNASPQIQEPHYETLEPQDVLIIGEEDMETDIPPPRPLLSSLAARLSHSSHHSHPSPCHVAYSGIQSPTDSDRSSSLDGLQPLSRLAPSTPSSAGNDVTDSLPDLDRTRTDSTGIPASLTY